MQRSGVIVVNEKKILMANIVDKGQTDFQMKRVKEVKLTIQYQVKIEVSKS